MSLRSPTENENAWERFLASARNDNACHLERSVRSFSNPIFEGGTKDTKVGIKLRALRDLGGETEFSWKIGITLWSARKLARAGKLFKHSYHHSIISTLHHSITLILFHGTSMTRFI